MKQVKQNKNKNKTKQNKMEKLIKIPIEYS